MVVLGIDPGSLVTGYAFLKQDAPGQPIQTLEYGAVRARSSDSLIRRLGTICFGLEPRIEEFKPDLMAMEASFYSENARTALVLGHARGAVMALAFRHGLDFVEFSPRSVKQAVTGSGAANKDRVARMMQAHLRLAELPKPADASDALAVAWTSLGGNAISRLPKASSMRKPYSRLEPSAGLLGQGTTYVANALPAGADLSKILRQARKGKRR